MSTTTIIVAIATVNPRIRMFQHTDIGTWLVFGVLLLVIIILISAYNKLNRNRNQIENAKSSLDALFIKRNDLIPNLITVTKQYTQYEKETLDKITKLRQMPQTNSAYQQDDELSALMKKVMVQVENYPELKAHTQFTNLQYSWNEIEEQISAGRRYLSASITEYNDAVRIFPSNIIAGLFHFKTHQWERATDAQRQAVNAQDLFQL
jgi:LemA protein